MKTSALLITLAITLFSSIAFAADTVRINANGYTIEFPCSEITDDTNLTCAEACAELNTQESVSCEVIDGTMYIESDEWISQMAVERAVSDLDTSDSKPPVKRATTDR